MFSLPTLRFALRPALASMLVTGWLTADARAETIQAAAYTIDIRSGLTFSGNPDDPIGQTSTSRMSVLQRMNAASKPCITITNVSDELALAGFQVDLSNSASMVTDVQWLDAPGRTGWTWDAASLSAFFQFFDPLLPGESATMKLSTAAQPGKELDYKMNQTLFHPCVGDCFTSQEGFGVLTMYSLPVEDLELLADGSRSFDSSGRPVGENLSVLTLNLGDSPLTQEQIVSPSAQSLNVVPVPEPGSVVLAASAFVAIAGASLRGRRMGRAA